MSASGEARAAGAGQFEIPAGIAVNSQANQVYVSSSYDDRIEISIPRVITRDSGVPRVPEAVFSQPLGRVLGR